MPSCLSAFLLSASFLSGSSLPRLAARHFNHLGSVQIRLDELRWDELYKCCVYVVDRTAHFQRCHLCHCESAASRHRSSPIISNHETSYLPPSPENSSHSWVSYTLHWHVMYTAEVSEHRVLKKCITARWWDPHDVPQLTTTLYAELHPSAVNQVLVFRRLFISSRQSSSSTVDCTCILCTSVVDLSPHYAVNATPPALTVDTHRRSVGGT